MHLESLGALQGIQQVFTVSPEVYLETMIASGMHCRPSCKFW